MPAWPGSSRYFFSGVSLACLGSVPSSSRFHSIDYPDKSRFVRVTGVNLDNITRIRIYLKSGEVHQMTPQRAT